MTVYGGFWVRVVAYFIDAILLGIVGFLIGAVLGVGSFSYSRLIGADSADPALAGAQMLSSLVNLVLGWLYYAIMESSEKQATLGKMALGLVVSDDSGNRIGFGRATGRYFAKILSGILLGIGFIMVAFSDRKKGLHDMIAGTVVTKKGTFTGTDQAAVFS